MTHHSWSLHSLVLLAHLSFSMFANAPAQFHFADKWAFAQHWTPALRAFFSAMTVARLIQEMWSSSGLRRGPTIARSIRLCVDLSFLICATVSFQDSAHHSADFETVESNNNKRFLSEAARFCRSERSEWYFAQAALKRLANSACVFPFIVTIVPRTLKPSEQLH